MAEKQPFLREESGLVSLESYLPYLVDPPDQVPIDPATGQDEQFVYQHIYFQASKYYQKHIPEGERDPRLTALRNSPYNQILMRPKRELKLHKEHEDHVEIPGDEVIDQALADYYDLDIVGASSLGLIALRNAKKRSIHKLSLYRPLGRNLSHADKLDIFETHLDNVLVSLENPRVTPERVVASALKRISGLLQDKRLDRLAEELMPEDRIYYPLKVPRIGYLLEISKSLLKQACEIQEIHEPVRLSAVA